MNQPGRKEGRGGGREGRSADRGEGRRQVHWLGTKKHKDGKGRERKDPTSFRFIIQLTSLRMFLSFITNWYTIYNEILRLNYSFLPFCKDRI